MALLGKGVWISRPEDGYPASRNNGTYSAMALFEGTPSRGQDAGGSRGARGSFRPPLMCRPQSANSLFYTKIELLKKDSKDQS